MKRFPFRTAHPGPASWIPGGLRRCAAAAAVMGLAVSMSANGSSSQPSADAHTKTTANAKPKHRWFQVGIASWYGHEFQGRRTAAGERFDMNSMTCAHPTLPMGTWLRVTNLKNRHTTFVRVNDRGPALDGRIVDLSFAAAHALGLKGLGKVKLEPLQTGDPDLVKGLMAQARVPVLFDPSGRDHSRVVLN
jgi:rare lipoprotein A